MQDKKQPLHTCGRCYGEFVCAAGSRDKFCTCRRYVRSDPILLPKTLFLCLSCNEKDRPVGDADDDNKEEEEEEEDSEDDESSESESDGESRCN